VLFTQNFTNEPTHVRWPVKVTVITDDNVIVSIFVYLTTVQVHYKLYLVYFSLYYCITAVIQRIGFGISIDTKFYGN